MIQSTVDGMRYAGSDSSKAYFGTNLARLQALKATWDPHNTLAWPFGIQPAAAVS